MQDLFHQHRFQIHFSNECHFKCIYCSPKYSSQWQKEINEFGRYGNQQEEKEEEGGNSSAPHIVASQSSKFLQFLKSAQTRPIENGKANPTHKLTISGGEPLIHPKTYETLRWLATQDFSNLEVLVCSNLCPSEALWTDFIRTVIGLENVKTLKAFRLLASIDAWGARSEFIRDGLQLELFENHIEDYLSQTQSHLTIVCTLTNLSLGGLLPLWQKLFDWKQRFANKNRDVTIQTEIIKKPRFQTLSILPEPFSVYLKNTLRFAQEHLAQNDPRWFQQSEVSALHAALNEINVPSSDTDSYRAEFYTFFRELQIRRQVDLLNTFPEMARFWRECEHDWAICSDDLSQPSHSPLAP